MNSFGSAPPTQIPNPGHFLSRQTVASKSYGSFSTPHAITQSALMVPITLNGGSEFIVLSDLDLAALVDIGWEVKLPADLIPRFMAPGQVVIDFPTSSFMHYAIARGPDLRSFPVRENFPGTAEVLTFTSDQAPSPRAFYQLEATSRFPQPDALRSSRTTQATTGEIKTIGPVLPRIVSDCCTHHEESAPNEDPAQ